MKLKDSSVFLICTLCICWPVGLIFLILSDKKVWQKVLFGVLGALVFIILLFPATLRTNTRPKPADFDLITTRSTLSVGQSGGFTVANDTENFTNFTAIASNDCIAINNNVYTALKPGTCTLNVSFSDQTRMVTITVTDAEETDTVVYASPTGERYHSYLKHAGKTALEMTEEEALQSGKTPCKTCWK